MSHTTHATRLTAAALCLAAGIVLPSLGYAQVPPTRAFTPYLPDAATDSVLVVVELRRPAAIEYDLEVVTTRRAAAVLGESTARLFQSRAETKIKIKDTEIDALKARIDQAKSEGNEQRKRQLETQRDLAEVEKKLLKRREQLRREEIDYAKAEIDFHDTQMQALSSELELARMRARRADITGTIPTQERFEAAWRFDKQVRELEGATLDAQGKAAKQQKELVERAVDINKARKKVWESQRDLIEESGAMN